MLFKHEFWPECEIMPKKQRRGEGVKEKGSTATAPVIKPF